MGNNKEGTSTPEKIDELGQIIRVEINKVGNQMVEDLYVVVENENWNRALPAVFEDASYAHASEADSNYLREHNAPLVRFNSKTGIPKDTRDEVHDFVDSLDM